MLVYNFHTLVLNTHNMYMSFLTTCLKVLFKRKKWMYLFLRFPSNRHVGSLKIISETGILLWRDVREISLLTGSSPRRRLLMTKKRSSHGVMIMVEPVRLSALPSPPAPLHLDPSSLPGSCSSAQEQQQEMDRWSPAAPSRLSTRKQQRGRLPTGAYILIRAGTWARSKRGGFPHLVVAFRAIATHTLH